MSAVGRLTWRRLATVFAASLRDKTCTDHAQLCDECPYCRDTAAVQLYEAKVSGKSAVSWQEVVTALAVRFQHFEECAGHSAEAVDWSQCPFCRDENWWHSYVGFCRRRGVAAVRRDVDVIAERSVSVPLDVLLLETAVNQPLSRGSIRGGGRS